MVALSGDYDFQFMIEELAVGAEFNIPYIHVVVNNAYLGLIRQAQRGFDMDYCVQLSFENVNAPELDGYGVDHVKVAEGLGCKAIRVLEPDEILPALEHARELMFEHRVPVVVEVILERVTNIAMGTELDNVVEFEACPGRAARGARLSRSARQLGRSIWWVLRDPPTAATCTARRVRVTWITTSADDDSRNSTWSRPCWSRRGERA